MEGKLASTVGKKPWVVGLRQHSDCLLPGIGSAFCVQAHEGPL